MTAPFKSFINEISGPDQDVAFSFDCVGAEHLDL